MSAAGRWLPFLGWWPMVNRATAKADLSAALTGALVVLPQAVAFAAIAGLPPEFGLYAAMVPALVAALWGSSWHLVSGPTTAISIVVFAAISPLALAGSEKYIGLALTLTFLVGAIQLTMGLARLGALVNLISHTVIVGFTTAAACLIAASQLKNFFGLDVPRGLQFHEVLLFAALHLGETHLLVTLVGLVTLLAGLIARKRLKRMPYMIVAMLVGGIVAAALNFLLGADKTAIQTVGAPASGLPPLSLPDLSLSAINTMLFPALIIAVLGLTEAVAIARSIAARSGQRIDNNQEFVGQGLSNLAGCFFSAYTSSGSFNRSGVNFASGARTPLAAAMSAVFLLLIALLAAPLVGFLPVPAMAAILFLVAWGLVDFKQIKEILQRHPRERTIFALTFIGTLLDLEKGLFLGILTSLAFYLYQTSQPLIQERAPPRDQLGNQRRKFTEAGPNAPGCPQLAMLEVQGSVYFGAVDHVQGRLQAVDEVDPRRKWLFVLAQGISFVDLAGAHLLADEAARRRAIGGGLFMVGSPLRMLRMLIKGGQVLTIGRDRIVAHKGDALRKVYPMLDSDICRECKVRAFQECQAALPNGETRADPVPPELSAEAPPASEPEAATDPAPNKENPR